MTQNPTSWSEHLRANLSLYSEPLLREVVGRLLRPRGYWPVEELLDRIVETASNAPVVDRRLKELPVGCRRLLALIGLSRRPCWYVGHLVEMLVVLGEEDGLSCVRTLLELGLLYPRLAEAAEDGCGSFDEWLARPAAGLIVCAHPDVTRRALSEDLRLPDLSDEEGDGILRGQETPALEADGLEWPLRMAVVWQQASAAPFRLTQQGDFYKKDLERLTGDAAVGGQPTDSLHDIPEIGQLTAAWTVGTGILDERHGELFAGEFPEVWNAELPQVLASLWVVLLDVDKWNPITGRGSEELGHPYPGVYLLCLVLLARMPEASWCCPGALARWVLEKHPFWPHAGEPEVAGLQSFLLGMAYQLRLLQAKKSGQGAWRIRLSPLGRWLLLQGELPRVQAFAQTLLVQPNLEILLYRQGATPALIAALSRCASWKSLGAACNLQLEPETVYAALQHGETFESILQLFQQHGMKPTPAPVVDSLRTWAEKSERITVYRCGIVLEFLDADDLDDALARGIAALRLSDRLAIVAKESDLQLQHFRLRGNRDYTLPPEPCVSIHDDGITLDVDLDKSDLLLESEIRRFADEHDVPAPSTREYRITLASLTRAGDLGLTLDTLDTWFWTRCSQPLPPAARLLAAAKLSNEIETTELTMRRVTIIQLGNEELTNGLVQWPETKPLIQERLGPTTLVIDEEHLPALEETLHKLGMSLVDELKVDQGA